MHLCELETAKDIVDLSTRAPIEHGDFSALDFVLSHLFEAVALSNQSVFSIHSNAEPE